MYANEDPETLYADGGYPTAPSVLEVVTKDVEFIAPVDRARLSEDVMGRSSFKRSQGIGKLLVRRAAKVGFAVAYFHRSI